jgi:Secretion system C-terminal sorting domain
MKKAIAITLFLMGCFVAQSQNITAAEFFVDTDPGAGNGTPISVSAGSTVNFTASVPTTSLAPGFHFVAIRTRNANGTWGMFETRGFFISNNTTNSANITAAEFFVDTDPGVGNGTPIAVTAGAAVNFVASIPTTSLAAGFHFVAIRTRDADGKWGLFETRGFFISSNTTNVGNITAAEFFVDADPGVGNGTPVAVTAGAAVNFVASIPTTSLAAGFHFVAIRTRDADGKWGLFETRGFFISNNTTNASNITAAEFFVDTDPGVGNGTPVAVTAGATVNFVASVPTTSLAAGFHFVAIRTRDASGKWGLFEKRGFYISTATGNMGFVSSGEYFFDTDPGVGNGMSFNFTTPGNTVNENIIMNIPVGLSQGNHLLIARVKDANGFWSLMDTVRTITVSGIVTPLRFLSFTGEKINRTTALQWTTDNEVNTSHFEIERSKNGVSFNSIGRVNSVNSSGVHRYSFTDIAPVEGINFYRLKQVDRDRRISYTTIIKILHNSFGQVISLHPNPATNFVNIDFVSKRNLLLVGIFDAQGRQVLQTSLTNQGIIKLNISKLATGSYTIQISDGETNATASLIKQ